MHLIIDSVAAKELTHDVIAGFIRTTAKDIRINIVHGPVISDTEDAIMGIAIIAKSHISVHQSKATLETWIDVFSCERFEVDGVNISIRKFKALRTETL